MIISIIVAVAKNFAIGKNNDLLWHLPKDMQLFKNTTKGHCIITGRKNYFSIPEKYRPLPNRTNIVVTRDKSLKLDGAIVVNSIENALDIAKKNGENEVFIIGGGEIYKQSLHLTNKLYITEVDATFEDADTFFPDFEKKNWKKNSSKKYVKDNENKFDFEFIIYKKN